VSSGQQRTGIGVIDTSSLWAAATRLYGQESVFAHPSRALYANSQEYSLSLMHNIILYDELRTDFDILEEEEDWYRRPVSEIIRHLSGAVRIDPMPTTVNDDKIMSAILPVFAEKIQNGSLRSAPSGAYDALEGFDFDVNSLFGAVSEVAVTDQGSLADMGIAPEWGGDSRERLIGLGRYLSVTSRTIRYSAHSRQIQSQEGRPSAFCASPKRIELLRDYFDADYIASSQLGATGFTDLFAAFGLPKSGYDFSGMISKPLSLSDLGLAIGDLPTHEAIDRVLRLRDTDEACEIRRIWARQLWRGGSNAVEGYGTDQSMSNMTVGGDVYQIQIVGLPAGQQLQAVPRPIAKLIGELRAWLMNALKRNLG
jgi:hypothetical protein